jgi:hypothetical protein
MTPLRSKMIDDMQAAGLGAETQTVYLRAVATLAAYYRRALYSLRVTLACQMLASISSSSASIYTLFSWSMRTAAGSR